MLRTGGWIRGAGMRGSCAPDLLARREIAPGSAWRAARRRALCRLVALLAPLACQIPVQPSAAPSPASPASPSSPPIAAAPPAATPAEPTPEPPLLLRGGTVMTAAGPTQQHTDVLVVNGEIAAVGHELKAP